MAAAVLALSACAPQGRGGVDGFGDLGSPIPCYVPATVSALAELDEIAPGHEAPSAITCHTPMTFQTTSAGRMVYLITLPDGSQHAIGVWCSAGTVCGALLPADYFATPQPPAGGS